MKSLYVSAIALICATPALAQNNETVNQNQMDRAQNEQQISAEFINSDQQQIGTATLMNTPNGVLIKTDLRNLPAGPHAIHIHQKANCDAADGFKSAGDHYAPQGKKHGFKVDGGPHAGDLPNQVINENGELKVDILATNVTLDDGENTLLDQDGSALIVHSGQDDYESQPSGDAGDRIACAPIKSDQQAALDNDDRSADTADVTIINSADDERTASQLADNSNMQRENNDGSLTTQATSNDANQSMSIEPTAVQISLVYEGLSASRLLNEDVQGGNGETLGEIQDLVIGEDGTVKAIVVEGGGFLDIGDSTFRLPWSDVTFSTYSDIRVPITEENAEERGLYDLPEEVQLNQGEFLASQLIGDRALVKSGDNYGEVSDVIIGDDSKVIAILVDRNGDWGGGTYGYPYYGYSAGWEPGTNDYPLPFESVDLAATVPTIDKQRLNDDNS